MCCHQGQVHTFTKIRLGILLIIFTWDIAYQLRSNSIYGSVCLFVCLSVPNFRYEHMIRDPRPQVFLSPGQLPPFLRTLTLHPQDGHPPSLALSPTITKTFTHQTQDGHKPLLGHSSTITRMISHHFFPSELPVLKYHSEGETIL